MTRLQTHGLPSRRRTPRRPRFPAIQAPGEMAPRYAFTRNRTMPALAVVPCVLCDRPAELPFWHRTVAGRTAAGAAFCLDVPLGLEREDRRRPADDQAEPKRRAGTRARRRP